MSSIATCPDCAAKFALPTLASGDDFARCPACQAEFTIADVQKHGLPVSQSAETVAFPATTLAAWEERLKRAIESTATESSDADSSKSFSSRATVVEGSPEFDFHLDPPIEQPVGSFSAVPVKLPQTQDWFSSDQTKVDSREGEVPAELRVTNGHNSGSAGASPSRRTSDIHRRQRFALAKHAVSAVVFGVFGVILGQYALLWLRGPNADYLQLAGMLPNSLLPPVEIRQNFIPPQLTRDRVAPVPEPRETSPVETITRRLAESKPIEAEAEPDPPVAPPLLHDDAIEPAMAELPQTPLIPPTNTTLAEFTDLVTSARSAVPALLANEPMNSQESTRAKGHAYMAVCRLAERFDFVSDLSLGPQAEREAARARTLLRTAAATAAPQADFAKIVSLWWEHQERPTPGIFLVGRIEDVEPVGDHCLYQVAVERANQTTRIPVLVDGAEFQLGDQIGVVGTIVADPRTTLRDFPRNLPQVTVAQDSFAVAVD